MATENTPRPVVLQLNNSGSWKSLARFDAGDAVQSEKAYAAGEALGELDGKRTTLRIVTEGPLPVVLVRWDIEKGWAAA